MNSETAPYHENANFWDKTTPRVIGDIEQRPSVVNLLGNMKNRLVLEAGCGTGYVARMIADTGAIVFGVDTEIEMLKKGAEVERRLKADPKRITYMQSNILTLSQNFGPYYFDAITSVGVLPMLDPNRYTQFLKEAHETLKVGGKLVTSIEHPYLFSNSSPTRKEGQCWAKHKPLEEMNMGEGITFEERYYDVDGNEFISTVRCYSASFCINSAINAGFKIEEVREISVKKEHLISPNWGTEYGFPAFLQIKAIKERIE